jgi:hypothetical protein
MELTITVGGVDGETNFIMYTRHPYQAMKFITDHDHEGSTLSMTLRVDDEQVYRVLETLVKIDLELKAIHEGV